MMSFGKDNRTKCPCMSCPDKGCGAYHSQCVKYIEWRKELDEMMKAERECRKKNDTLCDDQKKRIWRNKRYSRQVRYNKSSKTD